VQLHVGIFDGIAGQPQGAGQGAGRRQFCAGSERAVQNQAAQGALDAQVQVERLEFGLVQADFQGVEGEGFFHAVCFNRAG